MRKAFIVATVWLCFLAGSPTHSQSADDTRPSKEASRLGTIATLAPLCTLRDEAWAHDLRNAEIEMLSRSAPHNDAVAILSYVEDEAVESFAETAAAIPCGPLGHDPDLARADRVVNAYRRKAGS